MLEGYSYAGVRWRVGGYPVTRLDYRQQMVQDTAHVVHGRVIRALLKGARPVTTVRMFTAALCAIPSTAFSRL